MENVKIKNGLILGGILVVLTLVLYLINPRLYLSWGSMISFVVILYFMYKTAVDVRNEEDGILPFGGAFVAAFVPMAVGLLISTLFTYVLHNFIATDLAELTKEIAIEAIEKISSMMGGDMTDEMIAEIEKEDYSLTIGKSLLSWGGSLLFGCIPALIIGAITKKSGDFA